MIDLLPLQPVCSLNKVQDGDGGLCVGLNEEGQLYVLYGLEGYLQVLSHPESWPILHFMVDEKVY